MLLTDPEPASSVFFLFYTYREEAYDDAEFRVKVTFNENPWNIDSL